MKGHIRYRCYGKRRITRLFRREPLYCGRTTDITRRIGEHARDKSWIAEVRKVVWDFYDTEEELARAETHAIRREGFIFNQQHGTRRFGFRIPCYRCKGKKRFRGFRVNNGKCFRCDDRGYEPFTARKVIELAAASVLFVVSVGVLAVSVINAGVMS